MLAERDYLYSEGVEYAKRFGSFNDVVVMKYEIEHSFFEMNLDISFKAVEDLTNYFIEQKFLS